MTTLRVASCSSCGRAIIWVTSPAGKAMPVDARPATVYALRGDDAVKVLHVIDRPGQVEDGVEAEKVYISHFATCPNAAEHSKRGKA